MQLTENDVLELLRYRHSGRRWLEILGCEYSTEGADQLRSQDEHIESVVASVIADVFNECGRFPRAPRLNGVYLEALESGAVMVIERERKDLWCKRTYSTLSEAIRVLLRKRFDRPEFLSGAPPPKPMTVESTPKWEKLTQSSEDES